MTTKSQTAKTATFEREITDQVKAAKLKLRFDRVVQWLSRNLKERLAMVVPEGQSVIITVTAPIARPVKTAEKLERLVRDGMAHRERRKTINGNKTRIRLTPHVAKHAPRVIVFVHNPESNSVAILDIAESRLLQRAAR